MCVNGLKYSIFYAKNDAKNCNFAHIRFTKFDTQLWLQKKMI
jgi:hypothetical protein